MDNLTLEHKVLIGLYLLSYFFAMFIQVKDPKTNVKFSDWVLAFVASFIGATIAYFIAFKWLNVGFRMGVTILASLVSYRTLTFIVSSDSQEAFAKGFLNGLLNLMNNLFNYKHRQNGND
jgi:hypothetical protein